MVDFMVGVAVGAVFAPFWLRLWGIVKVQALKLMGK